MTCYHRYYLRFTLRLYVTGFLKCYFSSLNYWNFVIFEYFIEKSSWIEGILGIERFLFTQIHFIRCTIKPNMTLSYRILAKTMDISRICYTAFYCIKINTHFSPLRASRSKTLHCFNSTIRKETSSYAGSHELESPRGKKIIFFFSQEIQVLFNFLIDGLNITFLPFWQIYILKQSEDSNFLN